jgi:hypothetical protein
MTDLPPGFELDQMPSATPTPPGFTGTRLTVNANSPPPGFEMDAPARGMGDKLTGATGERYQTWPERLARGIGSSIVSGVTLPHDVMTGEADPLSPRVADLAMLGVPMSPVSRAGGGWMTGLPSAGSVPTPMPAALEANLAAKNIGVDLPRAIATDSPITKFMGQVANKMPGGGPMQTRIGSALGQTADAVTNAATMAGGANDAMAAGQGFKGAVENSFKPAIKARVSDAYDQVDKFIDPAFIRPLNATQGTIADIMARRVASGESDPGKAVNTVLGGVVRPGGLTYQGVKDLRTRVGEMVDTGVFPEGMSQAELRRIYGSLSEDLQATVQGAGGENALAAFNKANATAKFVADWKDNLGKIIGTDRSGEGITAAILRMASDAPTADLKALTMARAAVPKTAWEDIASTTIGSLGKDRKGEFSPALFLNDFAKLSDRGKQVLFGSAGSGDVLPYLNDIAAVSKKFVEAGKLANTSGTAGHNAAFTMLGGGAVGLMHGSLLEPITALTTVVGNNLMARALSRPSSAASIAKWVRTYGEIASKPSAQTYAAFQIATRNLSNTVNSQFGARIAPADLMRSLQAPAKSAADENQ